MSERLNSICSFVDCRNNRSNTRGRGVKFYSFPSRPHDYERRQKWISSVKRINADGSPWKPAKNQRICSDHFITGQKSNNPFHPDYVPTVFPGRKSAKEEIVGLKKTARFNRWFQRWQDKNLKKGAAPNTGELLTDPLKVPRKKKQGSEPSILTELGLSATASTSKSEASPASEDVVDDIEISLIEDVVDNSNSRDPLCFEEEAGYKSLCRVCGQMESDMISLYDCPAFEMGLHRKIEDYLKIKIDKTGYLPTEICKSCISNLDSCDRFITMARNANIKLHEMFSEQMEYFVQNDPPMTCQYCDKEFRSPTLLKLHLTTHSTAAVFLCENCGKIFKNAEGLICHKRTHRSLSEKKKHACTSCDKTFRSKFDLLEHMNSHANVKPYSCSKCTKSFHRRAQLRQHALVHRAGTALKNTCVKCAKTFSRHSDLRMHMRRHELPRTFKCTVCSLTLPSINALLSHRKTHQPAKKEDLSDSKHSPNTLPTPATVQKEISSKGGNFQCKYCDNWLSSRSALAYHQKALHGGDKPYKCLQCDKSFISEGLKRIHENVHTDDKPYVCTICNKSFKSPTVLNQHMRDHSALTTYECPHCDKRFKRKGNLDVHMRVHTGQKPFACHVCEHTFAQKADMLKHVARQHSQLSPQSSGVKISDSSDEHEKHIQLSDNDDELEEHKEKVHLIDYNDELDDHKENIHLITIDD